MATAPGRKRITRRSKTDRREDVAHAGLHWLSWCVCISRVKLVKQQINGSDRVVLKADATADDLKEEALRLKTLLGYEVRHDKRRGTYVASHSFFQGKYVLMLAPD